VRDSYSADEVTKIEDQAYEVGKATGLREGKEEGFVDGMAAAHDVVWSTVDRLQQSLNDVMGVYIDMKSPIYDEQNQQARELEVAYRILSEFRERFADDYDEVMRKHKSD